MVFLFHQNTCFRSYKFTVRERENREQHMAYIIILISECVEISQLRIRLITRSNASTTDTKPKPTNIEAN